MNCESETQRPVSDSVSESAATVTALRLRPAAVLAFRVKFKTPKFSRRSLRRSLGPPATSRRMPPPGRPRRRARRRARRR